MATRKEKLLVSLEKDWKNNTIGAYKKARDNIKKEIATMMEKGIENQTELMRYNRLQKMQNSISEQVNELTGITTKNLNNTVKEGYVVNSNREFYNLENQSGVNLNFELMNKTAAIEAVKNPLDKVGFIKREKNNMAQLINQLNSEITTGIVQGKSYQQIAKGINDRFDIGYNKSLRIVTTETHRVLEKASDDRALEAYNEGLEIKRVWNSTLDERTRESHAKADGQEVGINEDFNVDGESLRYPGDPKGSAENTINCRCTADIITPRLESDYKRKTYEEWLQEKRKK